MQLFHRTTRHLALTDAGKLYRCSASEELLHGIEGAEAAAACVAEAVPRGTLGSTRARLFGMKVLTPLLPGFQKLYPELKVDLFAVGTAHRSCATQEFDVDLLIGTPNDPSLMQRRLLASERILVAAPGLCGAACRPCGFPANWRSHNCLTYWMGPGAGRLEVFGQASVLSEVAVPSAVHLQQRVRS